MLFTSWISNSPLNGDIKKDPLILVSFFHMAALTATGIHIVGSFSYFYSHFSLPWRVNLLNYSPTILNSLWWQWLWVFRHLVVIRHSDGEHMEEAVSLLSSVDQLSTWELPLPGSPSKLSPGCLWVSSRSHLPPTWASSRNPRERKKKKKK